MKQTIYLKRLDTHQELLIILIELIQFQDAWSKREDSCKSDEFRALFDRIFQPSKIELKKVFMARSVYEKIVEIIRKTSTIVDLGLPLKEVLWANLNQDDHLIVEYLRDCHELRELIEKQIVMMGRSPLERCTLKIGSFFTKKK